MGCRVGTGGDDPQGSQPAPVGLAEEGGAVGRERVADLREGPARGRVGGRGGAERAVEQRTSRRSGEPAEVHQAIDVRPRRMATIASAGPAKRLTRCGANGAAAGQDTSSTSRENPELLLITMRLLLDKRLPELAREVEHLGGLTRAQLR